MEKFSDYINCNNHFGNYNILLDDLNKVHQFASDVYAGKKGKEDRFIFE